MLCMKELKIYTKFDTGLYSKTPKEINAAFDFAHKNEIGIFSYFDIFGNLYIKYYSMKDVSKFVQLEDIIRNSFDKYMITEVRL